MIYQGKIWKFGDNINTDEMMPGSTFFKTPNASYKQLSQYCLQNVRPGWTKIVKPGDIIIAGKNFGYGSSRPAPRLFQALGISAIVADSIARIFFRNCINIGLPVVNCPGVSAIFKEGETAKINLAVGEIVNLSNNLSIFGENLPKNSPPDQILSAGGIDDYLKKFYGEK